MSPVQIRLDQNKGLKIKWDNGSESIIAVNYLRDQCPCAYCKGENIMLNASSVKPALKSSGNESRYIIENIKVVGGYAAQILWKDGHNKGLYTWDYLLTLNDTQSENINHEYKPLI